METRTNLNVAMSTDDREVIRQAAEADERSITQWARRILVRTARKQLKRKAPSNG